MTPSQFAATNILPLLARVVLCLAFLPQGWNNLMRDVEYTGKDAQRLRELGVRGITDPDPKQADVALGAVRGLRRRRGRGCGLRGRCGRRGLGGGRGLRRLILPLLARVVLCLAFLPQGWNNLMRDVEYTGKDAQRL
ncbi:MAG: hypothetical protein ACKOTD_11080, partial [Phycisphaerales bacterium]